MYFTQNRTDFAPSGTRSIRSETSSIRREVSSTRSGVDSIHSGTHSTRREVSSIRSEAGSTRSEAGSTQNEVHSTRSATSFTADGTHSTRSRTDWVRHGIDGAENELAGSKPGPHCPPSPGLSGILCARHSMTTRSTITKQAPQGSARGRRPSRPAPDARSPEKQAPAHLVARETSSCVRYLPTSGGALSVTLRSIVIRQSPQPRPMPGNLPHRLDRRRPADDLAGVERALQGQHFIDILADARVESLQHG